MTSQGILTGRAERRALREQERAARVQQVQDVRHTDEVHRPGRVVVAVPPGTNPTTPITTVGPDTQRTRTAANTPGAFGNWPFSPLTLRRQRVPRADEVVPGANNEVANASTSVTVRWRGNSAQTGPMQDVELPPEVRRQFTVQTNARPGDIEVIVSTSAGTSRTESGVGTDGDDPMIIG